MIGIKKRNFKTKEPKSSVTINNGPFHLIQASFSTLKVSRQYPLIAGMHRAADGALVGVLLVVGTMAALTLHWQHLWTVAFTRLEMTRDLSHRLTDSTAMLERHLLNTSRLPMSMVRTKTDDLLYLEHPNQSSYQNLKATSNFQLSDFFEDYSTRHGY